MSNDDRQEASNSDLVHVSTVRVSYLRSSTVAITLMTIGELS